MARCAPRVKVLLLLARRIIEQHARKMLTDEFLSICYP